MLGALVDDVLRDGWVRWRAGSAALSVPTAMLGVVALWRVIARGRAAETVNADECRREGAHVVLVAWRVVVMAPRAVVVRRLLAVDVDRVERVQLDGC